MAAAAAAAGTYVTGSTTGLFSRLTPPQEARREATLTIWSA